MESCASYTCLEASSHWCAASDEGPSPSKGELTSADAKTGAHKVLPTVGDCAIENGVFHSSHAATLKHEGIHGEDAKMGATELGRTLAAICGLRKQGV